MCHKFFVCTCLSIFVTHFVMCFFRCFDDFFVFYITFVANFVCVFYYYWWASSCVCDLNFCVTEDRTKVFARAFERQQQETKAKKRPRAKASRREVQQSPTKVSEPDPPDCPTCPDCTNCVSRCVSLDVRPECVSVDLRSAKTNRSIHVWEKPPVCLEQQSPNRAWLGKQGT